LIDYFEQPSREVRNLKSLHVGLSPLSGKVASVNKDLEKEKELRAKDVERMSHDLEKEKELRTKDVEKEKELRTKDVEMMSRDLEKERELRTKTEQIMLFALDHRVLDIKYGSEYEEFRNHLSKIKNEAERKEH
jgi:hypothetical protein